MQNKIAISVDVEDWYHSSAIFGKNIPQFEQNVKSLTKKHKNIDYVSKPTLNLLKIFDYFDIKATFFIVSHLGDTNPNLIKQIHDSGHEIACHSMYHSEAIDFRGEPLISKETFLRSTKKSKKTLESICEKEVVGYRAPGAFISGWMIDILEELGFKYDSSVSINSIYNKTDIRPKRVSTVPYYPKKGSLEVQQSHREIIEFPWSYWNFYGFKFPTGGGPFLRYFRHQYIINGLIDSLHRGHTMFYLHPLDIATKFPGIKNRKLFWYGRGKNTLTSLLKIIGFFQNRKVFTTHRDILNKLNI